MKPASSLDDRFSTGSDAAAEKEPDIAGICLRQGWRLIGNLTGIWLPSRVCRLPTTAHLRHERQRAFVRFGRPAALRSASP